MFKEHRGSPGAWGEGDLGMTDFMVYGVGSDSYSEPEGKPLDCSEQRHEMFRFKSS